MFFRTDEYVRCDAPAILLARRSRKFRKRLRAVLHAPEPFEVIGYGYGMSLHRLQGNPKRPYPKSIGRGFSVADYDAVMRGVFFGGGGRG